MILDDKLKMTVLYHIYKELLTKKKQDMFELYYFEDYSIIEISEIAQVSKNAVYNSIVNTQKSLLKYEQILNINAKYEQNVKLLKDNNVDCKIIEKLI